MTDESESRREFEAWYKKSCPFVPFHYAWDIWQASRQQSRTGTFRPIEDRDSTIAALELQLSQARTELADEKESTLDAEVEVTRLRFQLEEAALERERLRFKLFYFESFKGTSHRTSCTIWREDGQGHAQGFDGDTGPCNCGALENFEQKRAESLEAANRRLRDALKECYVDLGALLNAVDWELSPAVITQLRKSHDMAEAALHYSPSQEVKK